MDEVQRLRTTVEDMHARFQRMTEAPAPAPQPTYAERAAESKQKNEQIRADIRREFDAVPERPERTLSLNEIRDLEETGMGPTQHDRVMSSRAASRSRHMGDEAHKSVYAMLYSSEQRRARMEKRAPRSMREIAPNFFNTP